MKLHKFEKVVVPTPLGYFITVERCAYCGAEKGIHPETCSPTKEQVDMYASFLERAIKAIAKDVV